MAQSTVNLQKMRSAAQELDKIYAAMTGNRKTLDELVAELPKVWAGEGAQAYQKAYAENAKDFTLLAQAIRSCAVTLNEGAGSYSKADIAAADAIKAKMAKG